MFPIANFLLILSTIAVSTTLVLTNKFLFNTSFHWPISLSTFHFFLTYFLLEIMVQCNFIQRATSFPMSKRWLLGFYNVSGIVFMNLNLKMNSVGFYQLSKLCTIPIMIIYEFFFHNKKQTTSVLISLLILLIGLSLFTVNDVQFNIPGTIIAFVAIIATAVSQSQNNFLQRSFNINGPSMQHIVALQQATLALISSIFIEFFGENSFLKHTFGHYELLLISATGLLAVLSNVLAFAIIGKTSAVTYQVVGHVKTILIFVFGLIMFPPPNGETKAQFYKKITGLTISMIGVIFYTYLKLTENQKLNGEQVQPLKEPLSSLREEEYDKKDGNEFLQVESDHE
ncbi:hypothetical protein M9Y10_045321 [Tritrichomonas musculus]|uniref:Sugar phosphate transporter domain-containing protein n=1 Tax=Tritrichomonas musculus TaxID=1915356 RepID=A0ABR2JUX9_9EUKA